MKTKLKYPKYTYNRVGNLRLVVGISGNIFNAIRTQERRVNDYQCDAVLMRPEVLKPGAWSLHFDGEDFWFEGSKKQLDQFELEAAE
jgi:hypothetical protein